jgi:signal transduction histidine kinase
LIERLIRNISHEIKNPLTSIKGYAQLLLLKPDDRQLIIKSQKNIIQQIEYIELMLNNMYRIFMLKETIIRKFNIIDTIQIFVGNFVSIASNPIQFIYSEKEVSQESSEEYLKRLLELIINEFDWHHQKSVSIRLTLDKSEEIPVLKIILLGTDFSDLDKELFYLPFYSRKYYASGTSLYEAAIISSICGWNMSINDESNGFILRFNGKKL